MFRESFNSLNFKKRKSNYELPEYGEDFGHMCERIIARALQRTSGFIIEKIEESTKREDLIGKVDFWIKLKGIEEPIGIQYTTTANEEKFQDKKDKLRAKSYKASREYRPDSLISWKGNVDVLIIRGNKEKLAQYWKEGQKRKIDPSELVGEEIIRDFFSQLIFQLKEIDPHKANSIVDTFREEVAKKSENKKRGLKE